MSDAFARMPAISQRLHRYLRRGERAYNLEIEQFPHPGSSPDSADDLIAAAIPDRVEVRVGAGGALLVVSAECLVAAITDGASGYCSAGVWIDDELLRAPGVEGIPNSTEVPVAESLSEAEDVDFLWAQVATTNSSDQIGAIGPAGLGDSQRKRGLPALVVGIVNTSMQVDVSVPEGVHTVELRWSFECDDEAAVMLLAERRLLVRGA